MANIIMRNEFARQNLRNQRIFRDRVHALNKYNDLELYRRFRFDRETIFFLVNILELDISSFTHRNFSLSTSLQLLCALRFYASGSFQQVVGDCVNVHQSTIYRVIRKVTYALCRHKNQFIQFPEGANLRRMKEEFYNKSGVPNIVGAIDCSHVRIIRPHLHENVYVNRKGYHSINVLMFSVCAMIKANFWTSWQNGLGQFMTVEFLEAANYIEISKQEL
jgi:hypothetical protein